MEHAVLEAFDLRKSFGAMVAVDGLTVSLRQGEIRALIGPNGAGKTTFFNLLTGHLKADAGSVRLHGEVITSMPPYRIWRKGMSRTFQIPAFFPSMTVFENVQVAVISHLRLTKRFYVPQGTEGRERVMEILERVGLRGTVGEVSGHLSYGDLKKLELAMALANDPQVLLLDEPAAGMAPPERNALMALVQTIAKEKDLTIMFTEHDMDVVFSVAERVSVMHQGRLVADGSPGEVRSDLTVRSVYLGEEG
ncbi:MAG: ABC transporter ATP-binding protein [Thermodesulfobacteriota bacterium]